MLFPYFFQHLNPRKDVLEGDEQTSPCEALLWGSAPSCWLGCAAAGAGGALGAACAVRRAAVL